MLRRAKIIFAVVLIVLCGPSGMAFAQYTSPNYRVDQTFFGAGGELQDISPHYQARVAAGELGIDHAVGSNYQTYSGFNTTSRPVLEVAVTGGTFDLGVLTTSQVKAVSTTFTVRSYISSGYTVQIGGTSPNNSGHKLCNMSSAGCPSTTSTPGTEQFGVNLAANNLTGPGSFGATPQQVPDTTFGFGVANSGYNTTNSFKYVENDTVAHSASSSGITQYTMSAIANISTTTPGGSYGTSLFVNAVPTF